MTENVPEEPVIVHCFRHPTKAVVYSRFSKRDAADIIEYIDTLRAQLAGARAAIQVRDESNRKLIAASQRLEDRLNEALEKIEFASLPVGRAGVEWIAVSERLPKVDTEVLCYGRDTQEYFVDYRHRDEGLDEHVTHWQPLPDPPLSSLANGKGRANG